MTARNLDAAARAAREKAELAAATGNGAHALEACRVLSELFAAGYRLLELAPDEVLAVKPVLFEARRTSRCPCGKQIAPGDMAWWRRDESQAAHCDPCGRAKGWKAA